MPGQRQPIHDAAERGDLAAVRAELAKGVSTEVQDEGYCQTPLHRAAIKGEVEVVLELIKANANLEAKRSGGFTPLHMSETTEVAKLLMDHGADRGARANNGKTPAEQAGGGPQVASFIASYVPGAPAPAPPPAVGGFGGIGVAATAAPARQPARLTPRVAAPPPEPEPERQPRHQSGMRRGFFGAAPPTATAVPVARSAGAPAVRAVPLSREPQPAPAPRTPAAGGGGFFGGAARQPEPSRQTSSPRGGGGGSGGGRGQDHAAAMAALAEEDEEMKNSLEAVNLLSKARDLQRRNQAAGVGDEQGIDEVVTEMYERIMDLGGLAFGGSIPAAVLQKAGASEDDLTKVPTVVLTDAMIAEQCEQSGQDEVECILCYDVLRAGDKVARLSCGHFFHHSPPVPKRAELPDTLEIRGHACAITQFKALRYRAGAWECGVCERPQPTRKDLWMYHEGPIGTADDTGYDCCIRCTMRGGWIQAKNIPGTASCEAGGIEAWLDKTGSCPTCREEYKPPAPEPAMQGARPNEAHVKTLSAMGFGEDAARQCLSVAFNDVELAAQYCMEGIPANVARRA